MAKEEFLIERIAIGNGLEARNGAKLNHGKLFGSSVLFGNSESFFGIVLSSLKIRAKDGPFQRYLTVPLGERISKKDWGCIVFNIPVSFEEEQRDALTKQAVITFARKNPGISVIIGGPGDRTVSDEALRYYVIDHGELTYHTRNGNCIDAVIVNAVCCLRGPEIALKMKAIIEREESVYYRIAQGTRLVHKLKEKLQFMKLKGVEKRIMKTDPWYWITSLSRGVFVMRLQQSQKRAHCIVVDGNRSLILDSAEHYPMRLCKESLFISAGNPTLNSKVCFVEVYQLVNQVKSICE